MQAFWEKLRTQMGWIYGEKREEATTMAFPFIPPKGFSTFPAHWGRLPTQSQLFHALCLAAGHFPLSPFSFLLPYPSLSRLEAASSLGGLPLPGKHLPRTLGRLRALPLAHTTTTCTQKRRELKTHPSLFKKKHASSSKGRRTR